MIGKTLGLVVNCSSTMPRPKVRPEDRQRIGQACLQCRSSKIRCDSKFPCITCVNRGRGALCAYPEVDRRRLLRTPIQQRRGAADSTSSSPTVDASLLQSVPQDSPSVVLQDVNLGSSQILSPTSTAQGDGPTLVETPAHVQRAAPTTERDRGKRDISEPPFDRH